MPRGEGTYGSKRGRPSKKTTLKTPVKSTAPKARARAKAQALKVTGATGGRTVKARRRKK